MAKDEKKSNIDIYLILVIVLMVLAIGGGLWVTGQSILARLDVLSTQTRGQISRLETETFALRKQIQNIELKLGEQSPAHAPAAAPDATPEPAKASK